MWSHALACVSTVLPTQEDIQVLRYGIGQFYKVHADTIRDPEAGVRVRDDTHTHIHTHCHPAAPHMCSLSLVSLSSLWQWDLFVCVPVCVYARLQQACNNARLFSNMERFVHMPYPAIRTSARCVCKSAVCHACARACVCVSHT